MFSLSIFPSVGYWKQLRPKTVCVPDPGASYTERFGLVPIMLMVVIIFYMLGSNLFLQIRYILHHLLA